MEENEAETEERPSVNVSVHLLRRITAAMDADDYWIDRLARLDEVHTRENSLTVEEADDLLRGLERCAKPRESVCVYDKLRLTECLKQNRGRTLACAEEVNNFVDCVDKLSFEKLRPELADGSRRREKLSFAERFERMK